MKEINEKLQEKLSKLEQGELELTELESLVEDARELYERLLIVKYKAYENYGEPKETEVDEPAAQEVESNNEQEEAIDFSAMSDEAEVDEQPSFDFSAIDDSVQETEEKIDEVLGEESDLEMIPSEDIKSFSESEKEEDEIFPKSSGTKDQPADVNSLNQQLKNAEDELSLRKKLQNTPISDLKSEISIAKKFEYITFMFDGKNDVYEEAIATLNNCNDGEEAKNKLNEYSTQYNWDLENKSIIKFVELVERRYL